MSVFFNSAAQVGDKFGVNAVNSILSLFASEEAPTSPFTGQIWLDSSNSILELKRYNGSEWDVLFSLNAFKLGGHEASYFEPAFSKNNAFNKTFGSIAGKVCQGNDSRLSDARTPTSHDNTCHSKVFITRSDLWRDTSSNQTVNAFLQSGVSPIYSTSSVTVTFDLAYTYPPRVVATTQGAMDNAACSSITTTSFVLSGGRISTAGVTHTTAVWISLGRKN